MISHVRETTSSSVGPAWTSGPGRQSPSCVRGACRTSCQQCAHATFLSTPTTRPSTCTSRERIGSMVSCLRLQANVVALPEEALDSRVLPQQRHDDVAVRGRVLRVHDHQVSGQDAGVDHRVTAHGEDVLAFVAADP